MTNTELMAAFVSLFSLAGLLVLLRLYRDYTVDRFRQEMFALRDEVFDFAASGGIAFRHPAYGTLRLTMNGFVRWADRLRLMDVVFLRLMSRRDVGENTKFDADWERALDSLDDTSRRRMNEFRDRMHQVLIAHLLRRAPVVFATLIVSVVTWAMGIRLANFVLERTKALLAGVDAEAFGRAPAPTDEWPHAETPAPA